MSTFGLVFDSSLKITNPSSSNAAATPPTGIPPTTTLPTTTPPSTTPPPYGRNLDIVHDGDVILDVSAGDISRRYRVYSQVLCATSVVFRNMLGKQSKFAEAVALRESHKRNDGEPVAVTLQGDDPAMMGFVLHVLHGQYKQMPRKITIGRMVRISIICDKYSLHEAMQLIAVVWCDMLKTKAKTHLTDWLLISWVFGPEDIFTEVSRDLMLGKICDSDDGLLFGNQKLPLADCIPAAISAKLMEGRQRWVNSIRARVESIENTYIGEDKEWKAVCSQGLNARQCDAMQIGLLYQSFLIGSGPYSESLINISDRVKEIPVLKIGVFKVGEGFCHCGIHQPPVLHSCIFTNSHSDCSWVSKLYKAMDDCMEMCKGLKFSEFPSRTWDN